MRPELIDLCCRRRHIGTVALDRRRRRAAGNHAARQLPFQGGGGGLGWRASGTAARSWGTGGWRFVCSSCRCWGVYCPVPAASSGSSGQTCPPLHAASLLLPGYLQLRHGKRVSRLFLCFEDALHAAPATAPQTSYCRLQARVYRLVHADGSGTGKVLKVSPFSKLNFEKVL
jgi:hypothetical protein